MGNLEFIKGRFREYYLQEDIVLPPRFTRREYGFMFFDKNYVLRHKGFRNRKEIKRFLVDNVPRHAYYSTAYYRFPDRKDMKEKGWMGADLIFDLDADHLPETEGMSYLQMLGVVKKEAEKLVENFLFSDFGFDDKDITIAFSGGRGFHIYVRNTNVYTLGSDERREIVNYITGEGVDFLKIMEVRETTGGKRAKKIMERFVYALPPENAGGWYGKISRGFVEVSKNLLEIYNEGGESALVEELNSIIKNKKFAKKLAKELLSKSGNFSTKLERLIGDQRSEKLQTFSSDKLRELYLSYLKEKLRIRGETDEPVTTDVHRLIRLIGSLHGKTGFIVRQLTYKEFKNFDPSNPNDIINTVVPQVFKEGSSKIAFREGVDIPFLQGPVGGEKCVPDYVAVFSVLRGLGDFITKC